MLLAASSRWKHADFSLCVNWPWTAWSAEEPEQQQQLGSATSHVAAHCGKKNRKDAISINSRHVKPPPQSLTFNPLVHRVTNGTSNLVPQD